MEPLNNFDVDLDLASGLFGGDNDYQITWSVFRTLYDIIHTEDEQYCCFPQVYIPIIENLPSDYISWGNIWNLDYPDLLDTLWATFDDHYFQTSELFQFLFMYHFKFIFYVRMSSQASHAACVLDLHFSWFILMSLHSKQ